VRECAWCRKFFEPNSGRQKHCPACLSDPDVIRERARLRKAAQREREKKNRAGRAWASAPKTREDEKRCPSCRRKFTPASNRQIWCGDCRREARREYLAWYMRRWRARAALKRQMPGVNT
jgi:Zn finger protein HypA/HybF involved in hydrogenase expression